MDIQDKVERKKISELTPYVNNPKEHPAEQVEKIASSIKEFGFTVPIVIDGGDTIIMGHGRIQAAKKLDLDEVPVIVRDDLTEAQVKALRIADNKVAESGWEYESLEAELESLDEFDFNMELTGFDDDEIVDMMALQPEKIDKIPEVDSGDSDFVKKTFDLHIEQEQVVDEAIKKCKNNEELSEDLNGNSNGNAITKICGLYNEQG